MDHTNQLAHKQLVLVYARAVFSSLRLSHPKTQETLQIHLSIA
jgi:hypothetical protein